MTARRRPLRCRCRAHSAATAASCSSCPARCSAAGELGVDPDVVADVARQIADVVRTRRAGRGRRRRRQLLPRRRAVAARHGPRPRRLHGHARHGDELPRAAGLPGEAGRRDPRADRDHDGPGRRAVHPAPRDPAPGEGPRRHLRRRPRRAVTSPPTPPPRSARSRSAPRSC